jgi:hypothetical protein
MQERDALGPTGREVAERSPATELPAPELAEELDRERFGGMVAATVVIVACGLIFAGLTILVVVLLAG